MCLFLSGLRRCKLLGNEKILADTVMQGASEMRDMDSMVAILRWEGQIPISAYRMMAPGKRNAT